MARRGAVITAGLTPVIDCVGVSVELGGQLILDQLDFQISGGITAIVGESGSGKTTLLRAIAGFVPIGQGSIAIEGTNVDALAPEQRPVTLLFQEPRLFPALSVADNVSFGLRVRKVGARERTERALSLLTDIGLRDRADDPITGLSGGEQQRVALARALCIRPRAMLLDEPFSAVDAPRRRELRTLVRRLSTEHDTTMVFVTHDVRDAETMADTIAVLAQGRILQHDAVPVVLEHPTSDAVSKLTLTDERVQSAMADDPAAPSTTR